MNTNDGFDINRLESQANQLPGSLSITEFKAFPGCSDYTDEEAAKITDTLLRIASLLFERPISTLKHIDHNDSKQAA